MTEHCHDAAFIKLAEIKKKTFGKTMNSLHFCL